ncbi:hypothetical protein, partial [Nocardia africana]
MHDNSHPNDPTPPLQLDALHPYLSVVVLQCTSENAALAFDRLSDFLGAQPRPRAGRAVEMSARIRWHSDETLDTDPASVLVHGAEVSELFGVVWRVTASPSWIAEEAGFRDIAHSLVLALRQQDLVAVYADDGTARRLQRWLNTPPLPDWRRIPAQVLETALLHGEIKGLWLQGTHRRRSTKPDTKNISGVKLQDALDPAHDSSFALRSARAELDRSPERLAFKGKVGTTLANSSVWSSEPTIDFAHYIAAVMELLSLIRAAMNTKPTTAGLLPVLARQERNLPDVKGAYAVAVLTPDDLFSFPTTDDELGHDAELLQDAIHEIEGDPESSRFVLDVGVGGATGGRLGVTPTLVNDRYILDIGLRGVPTDLNRVEPVRQALGQGELLTVYYRSGHAFANNTFYSAPITTARFSNWDFLPFTGYRIDREKPEASGTQAIHDAIAKPGDTSLFAWVVDHYQQGWLICDDGSGEVADFIHIANDGTLTLIHVKAAKNPSPQREIAVVPYEVVISQAVKNTVYADPQALATSLTSPRITTPACWTDGTRVESPRVWCSPSFLGRMGRSCLRSTTKRPRPRL